MTNSRSAIIITIDGPSGAGKGTVAQIVAKKLGLDYLDTGAMYRAVALLISRKTINIDDEEELKNILLKAHITFERNTDKRINIELNGEDITNKIRTPEISSLSSYLATKRVVRTKLKEIQREVGIKGSIVADGRDMGTYVFPDADYKFFIDATLDERARRRWLQLKESGRDVALDEVKKEIELRDRQDSERSESPLHPAPNAVIIDTTNLSIDAVVEKITDIVGGNREA